MMKLPTYRGFERYLSRLPRRKSAGRRGDACACPLALYASKLNRGATVQVCIGSIKLSDHPGDALWHNSRWIREFITEIDTDRSNRRAVSAARALKVLRSAGRHMRRTA